MRDTIEVNGMTFEVHKYKNASVGDLARYAFRDLHDCYKNPSSTKLAIFNKWALWAIETEVEYFGVCSHNTRMFTLQGLLWYRGKRYILRISPSHNRAYLID